MVGLIEEAQEFFREYGVVFDIGNMEVFSKRFAEPFLSIRPDGTIQSMPTNESAAEFFDTVFLSWKQERYSSFATRDYDVTPIGKEAMLVTFTWEMLDKNKELIRDWRQSYNLVKQYGVWKVYASTFHITE